MSNRVERRRERCSRAIANDWQLSGVFTGGSGAPYDVTYSYQTAGANVNLTGSPNYRARIRRWRHRLGLLEQSVRAVQRDRVRGADLQQHRQRVGREPAERMLGPHDGSGNRAQHPGRRRRQMQFRVDVFNVFNSRRDQRAGQRQIQLNNPADPTTIPNNQFNADGRVNSTASDAGDGRRRRGDRRAGDAIGADAACGSCSERHGRKCVLMVRVARELRSNRSKTCRMIRCRTSWLEDSGSTLRRSWRGLPRWR